MTAVALNRTDEAIDILLREPQDSPCYVLALGNAAQGALRLGRFTEAEALAQAALNEAEVTGCPHAPSWVQFIRNLGESLIGQGRHAESLLVFNMAGNKASELILKYPKESDEIEIQKAHAFGSWGSAHLHLGNLDVAIEILRGARDLYAKHRANYVGVAEALTNYALALHGFKRNTDAELALREALPIAERLGNVEQVHRAKVALVQIGSKVVPDEDVYGVLLQAAQSAEAIELWSAAYVRYCIRAEVAARRGDCTVGLESVVHAERVEPYADAHDHNRAKLRTTKANLLEQSGASPSQLLPILIEGASLWLDQLSRPLVQGDVMAINEAMHEHFRLLAGNLLDDDRVDEALLSFEVGRAMAHAEEIDGRVLIRLRNSKLFDANGGRVKTNLLEQVRDKMQDDDVLLTIAVLPPNLIAFVIKKHSIDTVSALLPADAAMSAAIFKDIEALPVRLAERVGLNAVPYMVMSLAEMVRPVLGTGIVRAILPHDVLHYVPWRAALRYVGVPWAQLPAVIEFGLLSRLRASREPLPERCVALGHGKAGSIDLGAEASDFALAFGNNGRFVPNCRRSDLESALQSRVIVLVSCHGIAADRLKNGPLILELADGPCLASEVFGDSVSAPLVILSACDSGVYRMAWGDYPVGAAPRLIRLGARYCICARFPVAARFAARFFQELAGLLAQGLSTSDAFCSATRTLELEGADLWRDLGCLELLGRP